MTCDQAFQAYLISLLSTALPSFAEASAVRAASDQTDPPLGDRAAVVGCEDAGDYNGIPGHVLVNVKAVVEIRTALSEDPDGALFDAASEAVSEALFGIANDTALTGWDIRLGNLWAGSAVALDNLYRYRSYTTTALLQSNPQQGTNTNQEE
jgi:hypothetical protein